jgi:hypothetical protein
LALIAANGATSTASSLRDAIAPHAPPARRIAMAETTKSEPTLDKATAIDLASKLSAAVDAFAMPQQRAAIFEASESHLPGSPFGELPLQARLAQVDTVSAGAQHDF